jgi:hypothetical protein
MLEFGLKKMITAKVPRSQELQDKVGSFLAILASWR